MNNKFYKIIIKRRDLTIPPTKEEEAIISKTNNEKYRISKSFVVKVNSSIPHSHKLLEGFKFI